MICLVKLTVGLSALFADSLRLAGCSTAGMLTYLGLESLYIKGKPHSGNYSTGSNVNRTHMYSSVYLNCVRAVILSGCFIIVIGSSQPPPSTVACIVSATDLCNCIIGRLLLARCIRAKVSIGQICIGYAVLNDAVLYFRLREQENLILGILTKIRIAGCGIVIRYCLITVVYGSSKNYLFLKLVKCRFYKGAIEPCSYQACLVAVILCSVGILCILLCIDYHIAKNKNLVACNILGNYRPSDGLVCKPNHSIVRRTNSAILVATVNNVGICHTVALGPIVCLCIKRCHQCAIGHLALRIRAKDYRAAVAVRSANGAISINYIVNQKSANSTFVCAGMCAYVITIGAFSVLPIVCLLGYRNLTAAGIC